MNSFLDITDDMDRRLKFSVIVPIYNCEDYIEKCIKSIVDQEYTDYELILVDDGSTDASYQICSVYAVQNKNIKLFRQENSGPSVARNYGLSKAEGDYILFVDSDDSVSMDYFYVLEKKVSEYNPDILIFGRTGTITGVMAPENNHINGSKNIWKYYADTLNTVDYNSCCNKCYKNSRKMNNIRFPERTIVEEDLLYNLAALSHAESVLCISDILYCYNQRTSGSVTTKYNPDKFASIVSAYENKKQITKAWGDGRIIDRYRCNYLELLSAAINNLLYRSCPLRRSERLQQIKAMYTHPCTMECVNEIKATSSRARLMKCLIKGNFVHTSYFLHWLVFKLKRRK